MISQESFSSRFDSYSESSQCPKDIFAEFPVLYQKTAPSHPSKPRSSSTIRDTIVGKSSDELMPHYTSSFCSPPPPRNIPIVFSAPKPVLESVNAQKGRRIYVSINPVQSFNKADCYEMNKQQAIPHIVQPIKPTIAQNSSSFSVSQASIAQRKYSDSWLCSPNKKFCEKHLISIKSDKSSHITKFTKIVIEAKKYLFNGDFDSAFRYLADMIDKNIAHADIYYLFGEVSRLKGLYDQAIKYLTKATTFQMHSPYVYFSLGLLYIDTGHLIKAKEILSQFAEKANDPEGYFWLGKALSDSGQYSKSLSALSTAIKLNPKKAMYYLFRGQVYEMEGSALLGKCDYKAALAVDPKCLVPYYTKYKMSEEAGDLSTAESIRQFLLKMKSLRC